MNNPTAELDIVYVEAGLLRPAEYNPRKASEKECKDLKESISRFGMVDPIIVNSNAHRHNIVIGGHFRLRVAVEMGIKQMPVVYVDIPDIKKERELNLRLNKNSGEWDYGLLADFDEEMLKDVGFSSDDMQRIFNPDVTEDGFDADAEYGRIKEAQTKRGDLYRLGEHRLLCGDSTFIDDVNKLMQGELADMMFTDPPYNVNYSYAKYEAIGRKNRKYRDGGKIFNDNKTPDAFYHFLLDSFKNAHLVSKPCMAIYVCHATKTQREFFDAFRDAGFHFSQTIIWLKERMILAMGQDYHLVYEPILFGWKEGEKHYSNHQITKEREVWDLDRISFEERLDVWFLARDKSSDYIHPTQKPCRLPERAIKKNCPMGGLLYEPFNGSGSTMMACEQLGRRCYSIELDPKYVDVAVRRYEEFTGHKAERVN
jgi:DNA modification methylase